MDTGERTLAFASHTLAESNLSNGYIKLTDLSKPAGAEIAFVTDDVAGGVRNAVAAGASVISEPKIKPWGQTVTYVRSPDGSLIELCTPISS